MSKITKKQFLAVMDALGIEIEADKALGWHVHAYAPEGKKFRGHGIHNLSLFDSFTESPDWSVIARDMGDDPLEDCADPDCEVCYP